MTKRNGFHTAVRPAPVVTDTASGPVEWECIGPGGVRPEEPVVVQTWFEARDMASKLLGVEPAKIVATRKR